LRRHRLPSRRRRPLAWLLGALGLIAVPFPASAGIDEHLGQGMPLVLKDGRIANVTVHTIPFATGAEILAPAAKAAVEATFRPLATDCFLTAQTIGHVAPGIGRDGDTLAAHRLARARADGIQGVLAGLGMPQPAVASVWDWQFLVQESQVTLWIFSLNVGDDCEGTPLPIEAPSLAVMTDPLPDLASPSPEPTVAQSPASQTASDTAPSRPAEAAPRDLQLDDAAAQPASPEATAADAATDPDDATAADAAAEPELPEIAGIAPAPAETDATPAPVMTGDLGRAAGPDPLATAAVGPADGAAHPAATATTTMTTSTTTATSTTPPAATAPANAPPATDVAALDTAAPAPAAVTDNPALVITFDVNSSFFPAGAGRELRAFLQTLPEAEPVALALEVAVGTGDVRGVSGEEARRYNAWMAERRVQRVAEWLAENAGNRPITVTEQLAENDPSREVRLFATVPR
jgi:hypothetical protein